MSTGAVADGETLLVKQVIDAFVAEAPWSVPQPRAHEDHINPEPASAAIDLPSLYRELQGLTADAPESKGPRGYPTAT